MSNMNNTCSSFIEDFQKAGIYVNKKHKDGNKKPKYVDELTEFQAWVDSMNTNLNLSDALESYIQDNASISCELLKGCSSENSFKDCSENNLITLSGAVKSMQLFPDQHQCLMNTLHLTKNKCKITLKTKD